MSKRTELETRYNNIILMEDIVLEILSWLPVKSLLRCMCVCRDWKNIIPSRCFRELHRKRNHSSQPLFLTCSGRGTRRIINESHVEWIHYVTTVDLHGNVVHQWALPTFSKYLEMLKFPSGSKLVCFTDLKRFLSYNPSTRQLFHLPDSPCSSSLDSKMDSTNFAYIQSKDEYMLVHLLRNKHVCEILTFYISDDNFQLHYNEWRSIEITIMTGHEFFNSGVYVCGAFYWIAYDDANAKASYILSFNVDTELFSTIGLPQAISVTKLLELKDELYLMNKTEDNTTLQLWMLSSDVNKNKLWTLYWNINLKSLGYELVDCETFIYRLEYLQCYDLPRYILSGMWRFPQEGNYFYGKGTYIHTNLLTL